MNDDWQNDQLELAFAPLAEGEARSEGLEGTESLKGERRQQKPGGRTTDGGGPEHRELMIVESPTST